MYIHKKRLVLISIIFLILVSVGGCDTVEEAGREAELTVEVFSVKTMDLSRQVSYVGRISAQKEIKIVPEMQTKVVAVLVKPGDSVRAGQTLIRLDSSDFVAGKAQAQAAVEQAEAGKRTNDIRAEQAKANYERVKALHDGGAVSDAELEAARVNWELLTAGVAEAGVAQAQAGLAQVERQLSKCNITSPINGVVGSVDARVGEFPLPGMSIVSVSDGKDMEAEIMVSESEISYIKTGAEAKVSVKSADNLELNGEVSEVSNIADPYKRNYKVKIVFTNPEGRIKSGMSANIIVNTEVRPGVKVVPVNAVLARSGESLVFVLDENNRAHERVVVTGMSNYDFIEVLEGLEVGETVVTKGNSLLNENTLVKPVERKEKQ